VPRSLAKAGFEVTLLTPRNSLAERSRFVSRVAYLADETTPLQWIHAFAATVKAISPALVMPCDDISFRLLAMLVLSPPPQLQPLLQETLARLIRTSLGDPAHYRTTVDKTRLSSAAAQAGGRVPPHAVIAGPDDASAFASAHGYPVVIKRPFMASGVGVRIVADADELPGAVATLAAPMPDDLEPDASRRLLIQKHIDGHICHQHVAVWQGRMLAGYASDRLRADGGSRAPGTVVRYRNADELREFSERLVGAFGMTGLFAGEYLIERETGLPYLAEIRRIGAATHYGTVMNVDLCAALHAR